MFVSSAIRSAPPSARTVRRGRPNGLPGAAGPSRSSSAAGSRRARLRARGRGAARHRQPGGVAALVGGLALCPAQQLVANFNCCSHAQKHIGKSINAQRAVSLFSSRLPVEDHGDGPRRFVRNGQGHQEALSIRGNPDLTPIVPSRPERNLGRRTVRESAGPPSQTRLRRALPP